MAEKVLYVEREFFFETAIKRIEKVDIVLDIGCGIVPHDYIEPYVYICAEPYDEYVNVLQTKIKNNTDSVYIVLNYDWEKVTTEFGEQSVDTVFLIDVIEHLDKETGERLLKLTEKIARRQIVIFTPLGLTEQKTLHGGKDAWGLNGAAWQEHKSGWLPDDFDESWDIVACKDFHLHDNVGNVLDEPCGAFWAFKNIKNIRESSSALFYQEQHMSDMLFEQGKHSFTILKEEKEVLEQEKIALEHGKAVLDQEKIALEHEKAVLEQEKVALEQEKAALEHEKAVLCNRYKRLENFRESHVGRELLKCLRFVRRD